MKVGILVNDAIPGMGLPCSAPGLREWGFFEGLRQIGVDATILVRQGTIAKRVERWADIHGFALPDHVLVVEDDKIDETVSRFDFLVFHNWAAAAGIKLPAGARTRLVYDFFSASLVEQGYVSNDATFHETIRNKKVDLLRRSDLFIANGPGRATYARKFLSNLGIEATVYDLPMCTPWMAQDTPRPGIMWGGYQQYWTRKFDNGTVASLAARFADKRLVHVGSNQHYIFGTIHSDVRAKSDTQNSTRFDALTFEDYVSVNASCSAFLDISPMNEERCLSFSTRGALSISCGCPIVHNAETDLGRLVESYGAGATLSAEDDFSDPALLARAIEKCLDPSARDACKRLWADHFDNRIGAEKLVRVLKDA